MYIADSQNHRILAWADAASYQNGDRPALVLGQPGFTSANPMGLSYKGLNTPSGLAVDPASGDLYVADTGNSRVLRFADPFNNLSRVEPVAVLGQPTFQTLGPNNSSSTVGKSGLKTPQSLAFDAGGNLWVSDTGNHRVLRFPFASLNADKPAADLVLGQADYASALPNRGAAAAANTLYAPAGLAFDAQGALYIADFNNARVVKYTAPAADAAASGVFGQSNLTTRGVPAQPTDSSMAGPAGLAVSADGLLYVAVPLNHRILVFDAGAPAAAAKSVLGQLALSSADPDAGVFPLASESVLFGASDVKVDAAGNLLVADTGNNRVLYFPHAGKAATSVWGQADFHANGVNQVKARGINTPYKMAIDYSRAPFTLYVSDTNNNRVLVWRDAARFRSGDEADLAIGQPNLQLSAPNVDVYGKPSKTSLYAPRGIAVDTAGNLFVADSGNHRILRYPRPADQSGRITPDMVLGQADFTSAELSVVNGAGFHTPTGIVLAPNGNLLVSDTGNNRVLEFAPGAQAKTPAIRVYGQPDFTTAAAPAAPTAQNLLLPQGLFMDSAFNLYVADSGFNRVLIFSNTQKAAAAAPAASTVLGQDKFTLAVAASGANRLHGPVDVALDSTGNLYVSDLLNHRVLIYDPIAVLHSASATGVIGQNSLAGSSPNWDALNGFASARGMFRPEGLLGTVSIRPRKNLGGTLELLTAESAVEASELPAVTDTEVADLEASAGAIVEDPEWKA